MMMQLANDLAGTVHFSKDGYKFSFSEHRWKLSRSKTVSFYSLSSVVSEPLLTAFKMALLYYAVNLSADHTTSTHQRFLHFCRYLHTPEKTVRTLSGTDLANYRASLDARRQWYVIVLSGLFKRWSSLGYTGIESDMLPVLQSWRLKGNIKGEAVQLQSPLDGALTDLEYTAVNDYLMNALERGAVSVEDASLVIILAFSGRRPLQVGDLQIQDFASASSNDGLVQYILNVPRRKQRAEAFRGAFRPFALNLENGLILNKHIELLQQTKGQVQAYLGARFPIYPDWTKVRRHSASSLEDLSRLPVDYFHVTAVQIRNRMSTIFADCEILSERTGMPVRLNPIRWRRTMGTRAAREGYGPLLIAELLDHTDTQNAHVYVENIPEHVDAINKALAMELAPIAQAFAGKLISNESEAVRGADPASRIRTNGGSIAGNCGHYGFCGALAPIACYTCSNFQPWVHGPHEDILDHLLADNARIQHLTGDAVISSINNRTILAVTQVVEMCRLRKTALEVGGE